MGEALLDSSEVVHGLDHFGLDRSALEEPECVIGLDEMLLERIDGLQIPLNLGLVVVARFIGSRQV